MFAESTLTRRLASLAALVTLLFAAPLHAGPKIEHWITDNGARVYFVHTPDIPIVDLRVTFDAGSARDAGRAGLAALTASLLDQGAGGLTAQQIAERFENVGAELDTGSLRDMAWLAVRSLTDPRRLQPALATLKALLTAPDFPQEALERQRARMLVGLKAQQQDPGDVAEKAFYRALYGDHPYASPPEGTEESLAALDREAVVAFHHRYYVARNAVVAITGAVTRAEAERMTRELIGALPAGERAPALPPVPPLHEAKVIRIAHPSTQTHIYIGQPGMTRDDPDYFALYTANHSLGGSGLVSRLSGEIREKRGMAYSVYSYFLPMAAAGPFQMGMQTKNDQAEKARTLLMENLRRYVAEGPSDKEFRASVKNITGGFPLRIDSNSDINGYLASIGFYDLPLDYLDTFVAKIEHLDRATVGAAFARRIDPERLVTVIVGGGE